MTGLEIAIIGMSGRFPGAPTVAAFWDLVREGADGTREFTRDELIAAGAPPAVVDDPDYVRRRGAIDDIEAFDAELFGIARGEAELMDPQHRLFLECAWDVLEEAGCDPTREHRPIGLYASASSSQYLWHLYEQGVAGTLLRSAHAVLGNDSDYLPTRVAYKLDLRGPAVAIQTACSSSLVAVHVACQALIGGDCDMALAGGASVAVPQAAGYLYQEGGVLSRDGCCRAFDAEASGTVGGSGVALVVLKRLADALEDGDRVLAVIKGSAINNDGAAKAGFTAPGIDGQVRAIRLAQRRAEVEPDTITLIEAHGTGTALGDPIEVAALTRAFGDGVRRTQACAIGSVKSNIGHLDAAAGVAGLIKATLALQHRQIPPSRHFTRPNPQIDFAHGPFFVPTRAMPWESAAGVPRRAAVSSLGIGGTNAHVVLEEAPAPVPSGPGRGVPMLTLSAKTPAALQRLRVSLAEFLATHPDVDLFDAAYTLHVGRRPLAHRVAIACRVVEEAIAELRRDDPGPAPASGAIAPVFMFPGQGSQYVQMGRELAGAYPGVAATIAECLGALPSPVAVRVRGALYPPAETSADAADRTLQATDPGQLALFIIEYALARLWMSWGVAPYAMVGHSLGEYVAACLAGVWTLEETLRIVTARGTLMQATAPGAMVAVPLPASEARAYVTGGLALAAINTSQLCVIAGPEPEIAALETTLRHAGVAGRRLRTGRAFHSASMDPMLGEFGDLLRRVPPRPPAKPFVSTVTGGWISHAEATSVEYWVSQVRSPVLFASAIETLRAVGGAAFLELGPGAALAGFVAADYPDDVEPTPAICAGLARAAEGPASETASLHRAVAELWTHGLEVDWQAFHAGERRQRVALPTYPVERLRVWPASTRGRRGARGHEDRLDPIQIVRDQIQVMQAQLACWSSEA
jgi:acyl transferase domain-containing protein